MLLDETYLKKLIKEAVTEAMMKPAEVRQLATLALRAELAEFAIKQANTKIATQQFKGREDEEKQDEVIDAGNSPRRTGHDTGGAEEKKGRSEEEIVDEEKDVEVSVDERKEDELELVDVAAETKTLIDRPTFMDNLRKLLRSQDDVSKATTAAKQTLQDTFGVDKYKDVPEEDLSNLFTEIENALSA